MTRLGIEPQPLMLGLQLQNVSSSMHMTFLRHLLYVL